jgi:hypothetical protein
MTDRAAHEVVRCSRVGEDGSCGREQAIASRADGVGVRAVVAVPDAVAAWLSIAGWRYTKGGWLCPFCAAGQGGAS